MFFDLIFGVRGTEFLVFQLILTALCLVFLRILIVRSSRDERPPLKVPNPIDPYAVAFVRGGETEILRTAMVEAVNSGWVVQEGEKKPGVALYKKNDVRRETTVSGRELVAFDPFQKLVVDHFQVPNTASSIFEPGVVAKAKKEAEAYRSWVIKEGIWQDAPLDPTVNLVFWCMLFAVEGIGFTKFIKALSEHRDNVGFLAMILFFTPIVFLAFKQRSRLTPRGKTFLKDIQAACQSLYNYRSVETMLDRSLASNGGVLSDKSDPSEHRRNAYYSLNPGMIGVAGDASLPLLAMGIFGISALQGSTHDSLYKQYQKSAGTLSGCGSVASGCGSGCSSGSTCGGGSSCGGGGGCGGCGGGGD